MRKISLLLLVVTAIASAQLRVGVDVSRTMSTDLLIIKMNDKMDGIGFTLGYEQMLLSLAGVGAEYTVGGDEGIDMLFAYGVAKVPLGVPMFRGIIRAGYSKPLGDFSDMYDGGLAYGFGARFKLPVMPIGVEALYTIYPLKIKDDLGDGLSLDELDGLFDSQLKNLSLTATYSF